MNLDTDDVDEEDLIDGDVDDDDIEQAFQRQQFLQENPDFEGDFSDDFDDERIQFDPISNGIESKDDLDQVFFFL